LNGENKMVNYVKTNNETIAKELQKIGLRFYKKANGYYYFVKNENIIIPASLYVLDGNDIG
jgi:hypothetical protein